MSETAAAVATAEAAPAQLKFKVKKPRQRACDEKDEKGKVCYLFCLKHLERR